MATLFASVLTSATARAYLKASYEVRELASKKAYLMLAEEALSMQTRSRNDEHQLRLQELDNTFKVELAEAEKWFQRVQADERKWIASGGDADALFLAKYYAPLQVTGVPVEEPLLPVNRSLVIILVISSLLSVLAIFLYRKIKKRASGA